MAKSRQASRAVHGDAASDPEQGRCLGVCTADGREAPGWDNAPATGGLSYQDRAQTAQAGRLAEEAGHTIKAAGHALADPVGHQRELVPDAMGLSCGTRNL